MWKGASEQVGYLDILRIKKEIICEFRTNFIIILNYKNINKKKQKKKIT
jgi:hypothetical protein